MIQSLERAFSLLELLDRSGDAGMTLSDASRANGLKAPTARNILTSLMELGYVSQDVATRRYRLGKQARRLGHHDHRLDTLRSIADPVLASLQRELNETVLLAVYDEGYRHTILSYESDHELRVGASVGVDDHFYDTATGRLLLALLPDGERQHILTRLGSPTTEDWPETGVSGGLAQCLDEIRRQGWNDLKKRNSHIRALAAAVLPVGEGLYVALGGYYPAVRDVPKRALEIRASLLAAARQIEAEYKRSL